MEEPQQGETPNRFFSVKPDEKEKRDSKSLSLEPSIESDEGAGGRCWTLRCLQFLLPCLKKKGVWEPSQGDVFKSHDAEESKYPRVLRVLEHRIFDCIFILSCWLSIYLFLFSEGFLLKSRLLWGIIHLVNAIFALGLFFHWLQILIKSKYAKTNHGYTTRDIVWTLLSVFPADLIVLAIYTLNDKEDEENNPIQLWMITVSRLNYFLRIRFIMQYFAKWEDHLVVGDFKMFMIRTLFFATFLLHMFACIWHRLACTSFQLSHFLMTPDEALVAVCGRNTWIGKLKLKADVSILLDHKDWHVLATHYLVCIYWTIIATFRMGASDIRTSLSSDKEVAFVTFVEITAWIFVLALVSGTLASLFIEKDTERQNFLTRCFAIRYFMQFGEISKFIQDDVTKFYNYLWERSSGILNLDLVDVMPHAMKSEVFYDVNKFVLDQLPLLKGLETPFLMSVSVQTKHRYYMSGEILFRKNETAYSMYYLVKGHLEILTDDERHVMTTIRSGSSIGEIHLLQPYLHVATVRCGSDCEIRTLSRKHFKQVLNVYHQYIPVLQQSLETRLEQCGLLLALCEKHNNYQKAFQTLRDYSDAVEIPRSDFRHSFNNVTRVLPHGARDKAFQSKGRFSEDFDGMSLNSETVRRLQSMDSTSMSVSRERDKRSYEDMLAAAYEALENDVARAVALANDLNIPRPPLNVSAPDTSTRVTLGFKQQADSQNVCVSLFKRLKNPSRGKLDFAWKFVVCICAILVFWYYPFQFGFYNPFSPMTNKVAHIADVIFALNCIYDMMQIVVTPQKTFESCCEIAVYRFKSVYFYMRIFSWLPIEYALQPATGVAVKSSYFYLFKFNRLLEIHMVFRFLDEFEIRFRVLPVIMVMGKFALGLLFVAHIVSVFYSFVKTAELLEYRPAFYWAIVIVTSLGYGDLPSKTDAELGVEVVGMFAIIGLIGLHLKKSHITPNIIFWFFAGLLGLIIGVCTIIFLAAKVTAILANEERKRISFQQTFYALDKFMKNRKFPKSLMIRVKNYYNLQWKAHQGTLIPTGHSVIWDAPKSVRSRVGHAQAYESISRIPLFMYSPLFLQNEICVALKHYLIPPREVLLHPNELARELYIISKGYVEVCLDGRRIAVFSEGRYFGLNGLIFGLNTPFLFRTMTHCHVFCLTHANMMKVAISNPNFLRELDRLVRGNVAVNTSVPFEELPPYPTKHFWDGLGQKELFPDDGNQKEDTNAVSSWFKNSLPKLKRCYLLPNGTGLKWWMGFRIMFAICVTIFVPAQLAFPINHRISFIAMLWFDAVAWLDIVISLRVAYFGDTNQLVTSSSKMAKYYLSRSFLVDVLASFPADLIVYCLLRGKPDFNEMYHLVSLLRLNRMLQIYKFLLTNAILEKVIFKSLSFVMMIEIAPAMFIFINVTSCLAVLAVCGCSYNSRPIKCMDDSWILRGLRRLNNDNIKDTREELRSTFRAYFIALYWVTQSILSVGFGDIVIGPEAENQIVAIVVIFVGVVVVCYAGAKLTSGIIGEDPKKIELQEKMALFNDYLEQQRASKNLRRRVREAFYNAWEKTNGVSPTSLFLAMPPSLKTDVMKQLYGDTLKTSPLFANLDVPGIRMLAGCLQEIFFPEGEFLMKFGDLCSDMFFIAHGAVVCYNVRGIIMSQLGGGSIIGITSAFFHTHRLYTAIAVKDVNAYIFKKEHFMSFLNQYPHFRFTLETLAYQHYREAMTGPKINTAEFNVALSIQNETETSRQQSVKRSMSRTRSAGSFHTTVPDFEEELTPSTLTGREDGSGAGKYIFMSHAENQEKMEDLTRNPLKEDVLKNEDELSKTVTAKWYSPIVTFGRKSRDEMGLVHVCQEPGQCNIFTFTVHPVSTICKWVSLYLIIVALSTGITAYEIAFQRDDSADPSGLFTCRNVLEIFFVFRIVGNFHLGYYDETATLISSVKLISRRYVYKVDGLWLDFITTFPFYLIVELCSTHTIAEYVRSLQLLRVYLFVRYLQETDSSLRMKASRVKIMKITILLCFIFHFWACAWYLVACYGSTCTRGSWMDKTLNELLMNGEVESNDISVMSRYLLSLYYVTNALTATGFSNITARTNVEICLSIAMMFGTLFVIGYLVGEMAQCMASQVSTKMHYQHRLTVLENHFVSLGASNEKIAQVRDYFKLLWCRCKGVMLYNLVEELPYSLRSDVAMEVYGPNLKSARLLGKLDENLIRQLCARVRHEIYFPGSHIIRTGDVCTAMYFIKKGEVVVLDGSNLELCVEILYENECFGEVKVLLPKEQYRFSYVARIESEVGVLHKNDLEAVLKNHPKIFEELATKANKVKQRKQSKDEEDENPHSHHSVISSKSKKEA